MMGDRWLCIGAIFAPLPIVLLLLLQLLLLFGIAGLLAMLRPDGFGLRLLLRTLLPLLLRLPLSAVPLQLMNDVVAVIDPVEGDVGEDAADVL